LACYFILNRGVRRDGCYTALPDQNCSNVITGVGAYRYTPLEFGFLWEGREKGLRPW